MRVLSVAIDDLASDWRRIVDVSPRATPFQSWEWISGLSRVGMIPGEARLLSFQDGDRCVGIAPLTYVKPRRGLVKIMLVGGDYCDLIAEPGFEEPVLLSFLEYLEENRRGWDLVDFRNLRSDSLVLRLASVKSRFKVVRFPHQIYPATQLPSTWPEYKERLANSFRTQLRYYPNKLDKEFGGFQIKRATPSDVEDQMASLFRLHQMRWETKGEPGAFASEEMRRFHLAVARSFASDESLRLYIGTLGGREAAAFYGFARNGELIYYLGGFETDFAKFRPLKLLIARAIQDAIDEGLTVIDFVKGREEYKADWRAEDRQTYRLMIAGRSIRTKAVVAGLKLHPRIKGLARGFKSR